MPTLEEIKQFSSQFKILFQEAPPECPQLIIDNLCSLVTATVEFVLKAAHPDEDNLDGASCGKGPACANGSTKSEARCPHCKALL